MNRDTTNLDYLHKEYPKRFAKTEFWKQIKRTVNGEPVSEHDIDLIVGQITSQLGLRNCDQMLDLGCGNGALAARLFERIDKYTGVDFSEYLLSVAEEHFQPHDDIQYIQSDIRVIENYLPVAVNANKVLIYGCAGYLTRSELPELIGDLQKGLPQLQTIMIGNIADHNKAAEFFRGRSVSDYSLNDPQSAIGVWWEPIELMNVADELGFRSKCVSMPTQFYGHKYRFDLVLENTRV